MLLLWKVHRSSSRQLGDERLERGARWEERQGSGGDEDNQGWLLELGDQPGNSDDEEDVDKNIQDWLLELGDQPGRGILRGEGRLGGEPPLVPFHLPPHQVAGLTSSQLRVWWDLLIGFNFSTSFLSSLPAVVLFLLLHLRLHHHHHPSVHHVLSVLVHPHRSL